MKRIACVLVLLLVSNAASTKTPRQERRHLRALQRIVKHGLPDLSRFHNEARLEQKQISYIRACGELGDYHAKRFEEGQEPDLTTAMNYYDRVICLTTHVDSDLGDNDSYKARNSVCKRVAALYTNGRLRMSELSSIYAGHYVDVSGMRLQAAHAEKAATADAASIFFAAGNAGLSADTKPILTLLTAAAAASGKKLVIEAGGEKKEFEFVISWERINAIADKLVSDFGVERSSLILRYGWEGVDFNHCLIRLAQPDEDGPSQMPLPMVGAWEEG